ncbi:MAG TPA: S-layer homology domain-containing protein [Clostridia bacterium]|nr:S-layer homology domain-containing protein [Clostridia bacterium]
MRRTIAMILCMIMVVTGMVYAEPTDVKAIEAPANLTVELKTEDDGYPYFQLKVQVTESVKVLAEIITEDEANLFYEVECKVGNGGWEPTGAAHFNLGPVIDMNPKDMGIDADIDIKANVYEFRVRLGYYSSLGTDADGNSIAAEPVYSPYSNIASIGIEAYQKTYEGASAWATTELDKAAEYGFITEKISGKMSAPITREELCEVIMKMYEKIIGEANYSDLNAFTDTQNPEIYKAYELGITNGVGNGKYAPKDLTNREQVASMMHRAVKAINPGADFSTAGAEKFTDEKLISSWALESVKFMSKNGFIKGSNGYVDPKVTTTREQAVLIILRTYEKYGK